MYKKIIVFVFRTDYKVFIKLLFMFKYALLLLILNVSQAGAEVFAQKATINVKNMEMKHVFQELHKQTGYHFLYLSEDLKNVDPVSINVINMDIKQILEQCFIGQSLNYEIQKNRILIEPKSASDSRVIETGSVWQRIITGKVTDEANEGIAGVTVLVKGTNITAITDKSGTYKISVPSDATALIFTTVGSEKQEMPITSSSVMNIKMKGTMTNMDEVVVVGYGTQKKESLSGAISSIKSSEITTTKTENLISNIQGKMPGLLIRQQTGEPGVFDNMVSIRGYGSPLVIIDGVPRDGTIDLAQLNPDDVESISVLKDASAAIYGMNAANGVIIVTTKKGVAGKTAFSYSGLYGMKGATGIEGTVDAYTYRQIANEMQRNIGAAPTYSQEILDKYKNNEDGYTDHDWIKLFMHDWVFQQQQNVSVRGGSEKIKFFDSFSYTKDNGLLKGGIQSYSRYNFRSNTTAELTNNLTLNVSIAGRVDNTIAPREDFLWTFKTLMVNDRGKNWHTIADPNHLAAIDPENKNAYALVNKDIDGYRKRKNAQYQSTVELTYKVPKVTGLELTVLGAYDSWIGNSSQLQKSYKLYDYYTDNFVTKVGQDSYSTDVNQFQRLHARGQINYKRNWEKHSFNVTGVMEVTSTRNDFLQGSRRYVDFFTHDIINQGTSTTAANAGNRNFGKLAAYLTRINYDFGGKYLLEAAGRYDGSYRYHPSVRWTFFPSASAAWRISEESFFKDNVAALNNLKLRLSYGESGRDQGNAFEYVAAFTGNSSNGYVFDPSGGLTNGFIPAGVVNKEMSWVSSKTSNIGVDVELWNGKLGGSFDIFERRNSGLLASRFQSVPNTFGASFGQENLNSSVNKGLEFSITHRNKIGADFGYSVSGNFTYARTKQLHEERAPFNSSWDKWKNGNENRYNGRMWLYEYSGQYTALDQYENAPLMGGSAGNSKMLPGSYAIIDRNGDGIITESDMTPDHWTFGAVNPPIQYGLTLAASYKSFDLNTLFQGAAGYSINYRNNDIWGYGRYPTLHEKFLDRWHTVDASNDPYDPKTEWIAGRYPALRSNTSNTTDQHLVGIWRPKATYLRIKSVEVGYSLPNDLVKKAGLAKVRVFFNGFNLYTFTTKELRKADPERQERDWDANLTYPLMKSFNMGLNVNF